jgi:hypothetical protein
MISDSAHVAAANSRLQRTRTAALLSSGFHVLGARFVPLNLRRWTTRERVTSRITVGRISLAIIVTLVLVQVAAVVLAAPFFREANIGFDVLCAAGAALGLVGYLFALRSLRIEGRVARMFPRVVAALGLAFGGYVACLILLVNVYGS